LHQGDSGAIPERNKFGRLPVAHGDRASLVEQQRVHVACGLHGLTGHGDDIEPERAIDAGDADGGQERTDSGRNERDQERNQIGDVDWGLQIDCDRRHGSHHDDEDQRQNGEQYGQGHLAPTLCPAEHGVLIRIAVGVARGRIPVIAGAGSNSTTHAIELSKDAEACGADAVLSVVPYCNKPTQAGLYAHFRAVAQSNGLPIILYDVPSRTACGLADETVVRLAEMPQFIGLKDATGDVTRPARLRSVIGQEFRLLSGDDATASAFLTQGGNGCISVTSNVAPGLCRSMFLACKQGQTVVAQRLGNPIAQLTYALFREPNPVPLKYALSLLGLTSPKVRLPLVGLADQAKVEIAAVMAKLCDENPECIIGAMSGPKHCNHRVVAG
jgi:4-hydroxy-tetrahydrodipicolinate synthase